MKREEKSDEEEERDEGGGKKRVWAAAACARKKQKRANAHVKREHERGESMKYSSVFTRKKKWKPQKIDAGWCWKCWRETWRGFTLHHLLWNKMEEVVMSDDWERQSKASGLFILPNEQRATEWGKECSLICQKQNGSLEKAAPWGAHCKTNFQIYGCVDLMPLSDSFCLTGCTSCLRGLFYTETSLARNAAFSYWSWWSALSGRRRKE